MSLKKNMLGLVGILIGIGGITVAIFQDDLRPPPPPVQQQLKEKIMARGLELFGVEAEEEKRVDVVAIVYAACGLVALLLAAAAWIRKENHRIAGVAASLGVMAVAWEYVLIAVVIAVVILILSNLGL